MNIDSIAKENAILEALPGTAKHLCQTCQLPQATVSKLINKLILQNRAFHAGWVKPAGAMASMVYARGPKPLGYEPPAKPQSPRARKAASVSRETPKPKPIATPSAAHSLRLWDAENSTDHLFRKDAEPFSIPPQPALMALFGDEFMNGKTSAKFDEWTSKPLDWPKPERASDE